MTQVPDPFPDLADLKRALDHAAIVATTDVSGRITYVNDKFCEISKYAREDLLGADHRIINSGFHSRDFMRDLWRTIASGRVWNGEIRNRARDGTFYWVDTTIVPFVDGRGRPHQYVAIRFDITSRKMAEERLVEQGALARLGQMAAMVAHEVRNPLAGVKGAVQVLMDRRSQGGEDLAIMRDIISRIDDLGNLISDLMMFARPQPARPTTCDMRLLLAEALAVLKCDPAGASLDVTVDAPDLMITADDSLLRTAIVNLLLNAAQAMHGCGRIAVSVEYRECEWVLHVRDSGPGIAPGIRERIFEPFFTTKTRGGGLGLPIARRMAELHGGTLTLACPPEGGTVFTMKVPFRTLSTDGDSEAGRSASSAGS